MPAPAGSFRARLRDVGVACSSLLVLALLVGYALAGPTPELTAAVGPVVPQPGTSAVVQGRVTDASGDGLEGARIEVKRAERVFGSAVSDGDGRFRAMVKAPCGRYEISLRATTQGSNLETSPREYMCPGDAVPIEARIVTHGHFIWVPGPR